MNHLTAIRNAMTRLQLAYELAQKGDKGKAEALKLVEDAEKWVSTAKCELSPPIEKGSVG